MNVDKYAQDGVNIDLGDAMSQIAGRVCRESYNNSDFVKVVDLSQGNFRGPRGYTLVNVPDGCVNAGSVDGIGTRSVIFAASGELVHCPNSLIAMTAMDITRYGGFPLVLYNLLDVKGLGKDMDSASFQRFKNMFYALGNLARDHGYVILDGETAELSVCVSSEDPNSPTQFNWGGVMVGAYHPEKMILGNTLKAGQKIIVFRDVVRDNGVSSIRKALAMRHDDGDMKWFDNPAAQSDIAEAATPSVLYDRMFNDVNGWINSSGFEKKVNVHLIAHLSGGSFKSKLGEDLLRPQGLSAVLTDLFVPAPIMQKCKEWRGMSDEEAYKTWNGGQGALAVVDEEDVNRMLRYAGLYNIEAQVAGDIVEYRNDEKTVSIKSQFDGGGWIHY